ncbi:MAG: FtsX-like permease family protein [Flavobacteriaceae bacterium]|nr:FtsX-like permease family protein [Flavobacteriaceae bacterium]
MVSGVFGSSEAADQKNIFVPFASAQKLLRLDDGKISAVAIKVANPSDSKNTIKQLQKIFGDNFYVKSREELNETYYKMLNAEGLILNLVLGLILIVAMFNTVGAVIILIIEKQKDIKTLYKIGANKTQVSSVFFKHGLYLSFSGGALGLLLGCLIVFVQEQFGIIFLSGTSIPYPVVFDISNFGIVIGWMLVVGIGGALLSLLALKKVKL